DAARRSRDFPPTPEAWNRMTSYPKVWRRSLTRSTQPAVPPNDETATIGACLVLVSRFSTQFLAAAATANAAFSMTDSVMRLTATSPIGGYRAISLPATSHCAAAAPATALTTTLGRR